MPITCKIHHISTEGDDGNMDTVHYSNHLLYTVVLEKGKKGVVFHHQLEGKAQPGSSYKGGNKKKSVFFPGEAN